MAMTIMDTAMIIVQTIMTTDMAMIMILAMITTEIMTTIGITRKITDIMIIGTFMMITMMIPGTIFITMAANIIT